MSRERKHRIEGQVQENERFLRTLTENSLDLIMVADTEGVAQYVNPAVERVLGYEPEEFVGMTVPELLHPDDYEQVMRPFAWSATNPGIVSGYAEGRYRSKDGSWVWIEATGTNLPDDPAVGGILFVARDVTERVRAEAEIRRLNETLEERVRERTAQLEALVSKLEANQRMLRESEEMFRTTFELAAVGIAHVSPDGRWLRVNRKLCEIVGYPREELLQKTFQDITHSDDLGKDLDHLDKMLAGEIDNYSVEKRYVRRDYSQVWVNVTVSLVRGSSGEPGYFISVIEDIMERKRAERLLRSLTPRETEILRLLALGRTNREIAQELMFSVSTVKNHVQRIITKLDASDRTQAAARAVELGVISAQR